MKNPPEDDAPPALPAYIGQYETRQRSRLAAQTLRFGAAEIPLRCVVDIALGLDGEIEEIFARHGVDLDTAASAVSAPEWDPTVRRLKAEFEASGTVFTEKAKRLAEAVLPNAFDMATDVTTPAPVRADMIKWLAKAGALTDKKEAADPSAAAGPGFTFTINLVDRAGRVIDAGATRVLEGAALPPPETA